MLSADDLQKFGLPDDAYGVEVSDEMDARRLAYVVLQIGETKIRRHAQIYAEKWDGSKPYVSKIIKTFRIKVPTKIYCDEPQPLWGVYVLVPSDRECLKIGHTSNFVQRARNIYPSLWRQEPGNLARIFDLDQSMYYQCEERRYARALEAQLLQITIEDRASPPCNASFSGAAPTEWRNYSALPLITKTCSASELVRTAYTLSEGLHHMTMMSHCGGENLQ